MNNWVKYIASNIIPKSLIRLYSVTYLAYGYYRPTFGEGELFDATFKAWKFGVEMPNVTEEVFEDVFEFSIEDLTAKEIRVLTYLNMIIDRTNDVNDYGLMLRVMKDKAWEDNLNKVIPNDDIIKEYMIKC